MAREKETGREGARRGRIWDGNDGNKLFTYESFKNGLNLIQQRDDLHVNLLITGKSVNDKQTTNTGKPYH